MFGEKHKTRSMFKIVCFSPQPQSIRVEEIAPNADLYWNNSEVSQIEGPRKEEV